MGNKKFEDFTFEDLMNMLTKASVESYNDRIPDNSKPFNLDEWNKDERPVITRRGKSVTILRTDLRGGYPILGIVDLGNEDCPCMYYEDGTTDIDRGNLDLFIKLPEPEKKYTTIYRDATTGKYFSGPIYNSREDVPDEFRGWKLYKITEVEL